MLFSEPRFLVFFLVVFSVHWALGSNRLRKLWLLAASYVFYAGWDWRFLSLILLSTAVDYVAGLMMARDRPWGGRRSWLISSLVCNLGLLGFFKYFNFFIDSAVRFSEMLGLPFRQPSLEIVLPVGISFFTFQTMSYTIDVYRRKLDATSDLFDFALFVAFFPQLVAGPIVRARDFLPQLVKPRRFGRVDFRWLLTLFLFGFIKKSCISDHVAVVVDPVFAEPAGYSASAVWLAVLFYAVQIYCDFSGYTDMAIACGGLLGYRLPKNFDFPYFAFNITAFWQRWHISLSTWLRDYLYIPLGGNRGSRLFTYRNLMLTMLLGGLWHGAGWNFVLWGGLHGLALVVHRQWTSRVPDRWRETPVVRWLGPLLTFYWVCLLWIFFRAGTLADAAEMAQSWIAFRASGSRELDTWLWAGLAALTVAHLVMAVSRWEHWIHCVPDWVFSLAFGAGVAVALSFAATRYEPFIYFQF